MNARIPMLLLLAGLCGCTTTAPPADPFAGMREPLGMVVWQEEYRFSPPPSPWQLLELDESDYSIAFYRACRNTERRPCQTTMAYAEEPFGYSRDLRARQEEFFRRFLWAARVEFEEPRLETISALGGEALLAETVAHERVLQDKALVQAVFAHRGERVVAFYFTQWRPADIEFDRAQLAEFRDFVDSFSFRRPSFYQRLLEGTTVTGTP